MSHRRSPDRRPRGKSLGAVTVVVAALSTSCGEVPPPVPPGFVPAGEPFVDFGGALAQDGRLREHVVPLTQG